MSTRCPAPALQQAAASCARLSLLSGTVPKRLPSSRSAPGSICPLTPRSRPLPVPRPRHSLPACSTRRSRSARRARGQAPTRPTSRFSRVSSGSSPPLMSFPTTASRWACRCPSWEFSRPGGRRVLTRLWPPRPPSASLSTDEVAPIAQHARPRGHASGNCASSAKQTASAR